MEGKTLLLHLLLMLSSHFAWDLAIAAGEFPAIIVFGDSTVDTGNNNQIGTVLKSNFPPYGRDFFGGEATGRFGNGRLATDFLAEALGLGSVVPAYLDPKYGIEDFATRVCFASAGTGLDNATSDVLSVIPLWKEVEYFKQYKRRLRAHLGKPRAKQILNQSIYVVSIGTNDFLENYYSRITGRFNEFSVDAFQDFLVDLAGNFINDIYHLGARKIAFTSLGPIGCLPLERTIAGGDCIEEYNDVARDFNVKLNAMVDQLVASLPELRLKIVEVYDPLLHIIQNPSSYGIENVSQGCCATGLYEMGYLCNQWSHFTCPDADTFVFWDAFHPTEKVNKLMSDFWLRTTLPFFL